MTKDEKNARQREKYATDAVYREAQLQRGRDYTATEHGKELRRERKRRWQTQNREAWLAQCRRRNAKRSADPDARADAARRTREWYKANRVRAKDSSLQRLFGLTLTEYLAMMREQRNRCAICGAHEVARDRNGKRRRLAVDHDHVTGQVRALLCARCNHTLGRMNDSPELLRVAANYLEAFS